LAGCSGDAENAVKSGEINQAIGAAMGIDTMLQDAAALHAAALALHRSCEGYEGAGMNPPGPAKAMDVERTFAWISRNPRLMRDFERACPTWSRCWQHKR
jgi:hypothetical protein